jgi:UDP-N-acetylmuramoyl-tripeptide--D-alanyl-D-alanine ligase
MTSALATARRAWTLGTLAGAAGAMLGEARADTAIGGISIDTRTLEHGDLFVAVAGPRFDGHEFLSAAVSRGAPAAMVQHDVLSPPGLAIVRVADTTRALGDLARHIRRERDVPVVGVTGSTGKTTTKEMAAALLSARGAVLRTEGNLNNRYGVPLTLFRLRPEHSAVVLEMGMSARGELAELARIGEPDLAVITNVSPVHLEFFDSVEAIAEAKAEILLGLRPGGAAVLNRDDPHVRRIGEAFHGEVVWFGKGRACEVSVEKIRGSVHGMRFDLRVAGCKVDVALPLPGVHVVMDFAAAAAVAHRLGVSAETIAETALTLKAAEHRGQVRRLGEGVTLLDDCYNSNPAAVLAAAAALGTAARGRRVAFLGDMLELGERGPELHREAGRELAGELGLLAAVGPLARHFLEGAREAGLRKEALVSFPDAAAAAAAAPELVRPGDAVLVKGSRGMRLEAIVDALQARFGTGEE